MRTIWQLVDRICGCAGGREWTAVAALAPGCEDGPAMSTSSVGSPGRYQRSVGGLAAALVLTVVVVGGLIWLLGLFRPDVEIDPERVDYLPIVGEAQDAGFAPVYPASLPDGWTPTGYQVVPGEKPAFEMNLLTEDDEDFVGIRQDDEPEADMLREYVVGELSPTDIYTVRGSVAEAWQGYEDEDGDTAYVSEVAGETVLVYGSASPGELQDLIDRLSTEPVDAD